MAEQGKRRNIVAATASALFLATLATVGACFVLGYFGPLSDIDVWDGSRKNMAEIHKQLMLYATENDGVSPASLSGVAGKFGGTLPKDPFTGMDYHYRLTAAGFELESLGRDGSPGGATPPDQDILFNERGQVP